jgi:hypothetical protein
MTTLMPDDIDPDDLGEVESCRWFVMCNEPATTFEPHPILGDVPICQGCKDTLANLRTPQ